MIDDIRKSLSIWNIDAPVASDNENNEDPGSLLYKICSIPITSLREYGSEKRKHIFHLNEDEVDNICESIKECGRILEPLLVRQDPDGIADYEVLAGHHRKAAAEKAGLKEVPCHIIIDCDDLTASAIMVHSNTQRESLTIMERAYKYKVERDYIKASGRTSGRYTYDIIADEEDESASTIKRFITLTKLIDEFQADVDDAKIGLRGAYAVAQMSAASQHALYSVFSKSGTKLSNALCEEARKIEKENNKFSETDALALLTRTSPAKKNSYSLPEYVNSLFPAECDTKKKKEELIITLLEKYAGELGSENCDGAE